MRVSPQLSLTGGDAGLTRHWTRETNADEQLFYEMTAQ